jgi:hypothetical protein
MDTWVRGAKLLGGVTVLVNRAAEHKQMSKVKPKKMSDRVLNKRLFFTQASTGH